MIWFAPLVTLQAANQSFWHNIQLQGVFSIKADRYKTHTSGMHPGKQDGEMEVNGKPTDGTTIQCYLIRWHHAPAMLFPRDQDDSEQSGYDPKGIFGFRGNGLTLAAELLVAMDLQRLRISAGGGIRCSFLSEMTGEWIDNGTWNGDENEYYKSLTYTPSYAYYLTWTPLLRLGFKLIENQNHIFLMDGTWAPAIYSCSEWGQHYYWIYPLSFDIGITWEKQITDWINGSLRIAYDFFLQNDIIQDENPSSLDDMITVSHYRDGIMAQIGLGIRIPGLGKCAVAGCAIKQDHTHGGRHYGGG